MDYDILISKIRLIRKLKYQNDLEIIDNYYQSINHTCQNTTYIDKGYYFRRNGELYLCNPFEKERADFRAIECEQCHQEILLMNTGKENWDTLFFLQHDQNHILKKKK